MTEQERALRRLATFLARQQVPYVVIGGLAVAVWGEARATLDIDTSIWVPEDRVESFVLAAGKDFEILVDILSDRDRDDSDARAVAVRRMERLDLEYLEPRLRELAHLLEKPAILTRWEAWRQEAGG